jgi:ribonucleoside-triphosphate reductase
MSNHAQNRITNKYLNVLTYEAPITFILIIAYNVTQLKGAVLIFVDEEGRTLDRILDALASPIRIEMLKQLSKHDMNYTELIRSVGMNPQKDAGKFSYHLKKLLSSKLIKINEKTKLYELSHSGRTMLEVIEQAKKMLAGSDLLIVRRSECSIEAFDKNKIVNALVKEAGMPAKLAHKVASSVEEKLLDLKIEYLSAPLIRELVNSVLIDQGLEKYRHKLTRVGMPIYDVTQTIKNASKQGGTNAVMKAAANSVLKEYMLLNVLPRNVADAYLSGLIDICFLESWVVSVYGKAYDADLLNKVEGLGTCEALVANLMEDMFIVEKEFLLYNLSDIISNKKSSKQFASTLMKISSISTFEEHKFVLNAANNLEHAEDLIDAFNEHQRNNISIVVGKDLIEKAPPHYISKEGLELIFTTGSKSEVLASNGYKISIKNPENAESFLCGVAAMNVPRLALQSAGNEEEFMESVRRTMQLIITAFTKKMNLTNMLHGNVSIKHHFIVSPCGLFEAIKCLTGEYPTSSSPDILLNVLREMVKLALKGSKKDFQIGIANVCPPQSSKRMAKSDIDRFGFKTISGLSFYPVTSNFAYSTTIVPYDIKMPQEDRLQFEAKVAKVLNGGYMVMLSSPSKDKEIQESVDLAKKYLESGCDSLKFI